MPRQPACTRHRCVPRQALQRAPPGAMHETRRAVTTHTESQRPQTVSAGSPVEGCRTTPAVSLSAAMRLSPEDPTCAQLCLQSGTAQHSTLTPCYHSLRPGGRKPIPNRLRCQFNSLDRFVASGIGGTTHGRGRGCCGRCLVCSNLGGLVCVAGRGGGGEGGFMHMTGFYLQRWRQCTVSQCNSCNL